MRVTGNTFTDTLVNQLNLLAARQYRLQNQAAIGQRIQVPEDDPGGMARSLELLSESSHVGQYKQNISTLQDRATSAYNVLTAVKNVSDRVGDIATQGGDATLPLVDLQNYASEVTHMIKQAVQAMNTKDGEHYLFGGTASGQPPYTMTTDASGNVLSVTYNGNASVSQHEIAENTTIAVDVPGENSTGSGVRGVITDSRYGADFFNHLISLQNHLLTGDVGSVNTGEQPGLMNDENNLIAQIANNGVVQTRLQTTSSLADGRLSSLKQVLTNVAGADLTQTLVKLGEAQNAYQAALQTSSNILNLQQSLLSSLP
jgi:flagellar hook-associated protein 3 FlgL